MKTLLLPLPKYTLLVFLASLLLAGCGQLDPAPVVSSPTQPELTEPATRPETTAQSETATHPEAATQAETATQPVALGGYPAAATPTPFDYTQDEGYPAPETTNPPPELPESLEIPEPDDDSGVVTGQLLTPGPGGEPYIGSLFLATTISSDQEGFPPIVAFSDQTDPLAVQDQTGRFLFEDIAPGTYALVIWNPVASTVIEEPGTNEYMVFEVRAGELTDLGVIGIP